VSEIRDWHLILDKERYGDFGGKYPDLITVHGTQAQAETIQSDLSFVEAGCTDLFAFRDDLPDVKFCSVSWLPSGGHKRPTRATHWAMATDRSRLLLTVCAEHAAEVRDLVYPEDNSYHERKKGDPLWVCQEMKP
jgi:hypothetical protein